MTMTVQELLNQASEITGLHDFGDPGFREGLERLVASLNKSSIPTEIGKVAIPGHIVQLLVNRLKVEDWYRRHPEIENEIIREPVFITGLPRTGSTALGHMLALDSNTRSLRGWEAYEPCPPPDIRVKDDPRIAANEKRTEFITQIAPGIVEAIPLNPHAPDECYTLLDLSFACVGMDGRYNVPDFEDWAMMEDLPELDAAYRYHRRVLKLLQWKTPATRWVLRTPLHSTGINSLLKAYPDARFIWTHREPEKVLPSICSLIYQAREIFLTNPSPLQLGPRQLNQWSESIRRLMSAREQIGEARFFDIYHREIIADPELCIRNLYQWLGWEFGAEFVYRLRDWRKENPKGQHKPDPAFFGLNPDEVRRRFAFYIERFGAQV